MKRAVSWSPEAQTDLMDILHYISRDNPTAARRVVSEINRQGQSLDELAASRPGRVAGTFEKVLARLPYVLVYEILALPDGGEMIFTLHIIHMARNWPGEDPL